MKNYSKFLEKLNQDDIESYVWNSNEAIEDYLCYLNGWVSAPGKHGSDAHTVEGQAIELKTAAFTGNAENKVLCGRFTFSSPSLNIVERVKDEIIHIFGKDDITREIVYHFSISGAEFAQELERAVRAKGNATASYTFTTYKDYESFEIHSFDKKHMNKYPERWSENLIKLLVGEMEFYKKLHKEKLKGYHLLQIHKKRQRNGKLKTHFTIESKEYKLETTRAINKLHLWNPKSIYMRNSIKSFLEKTSLDVHGSYKELENVFHIKFGSTEGIPVLSSYKKIYYKHRDKANFN